jgi:Arc/MetJ-type ribon-helix-helix transcriptional regulator
MTPDRSPHQAIPIVVPSQVVTTPTTRYDTGMTRVAKITVSLPEEQVERVREAVARGDAASVSGYVSAALTGALAKPAPETEKDESALAELVAELIAEHGEPSAEAYAWADKVLSHAED